MIIVNRRQALTLLLGAAGAAGGSAALSQDRMKVAFILNGTPGDVGWNYEHARGIAMAEAAYGDQVQIDSFYGINEWGNGDADMILDLIMGGYDLVFACSFGYGQSLLQLALASPRTKFEHCGGFVRAENIATYSARWYEGRVAQGLIAGAMTKTNRVGYLASFQIPQVVRGINAAQVAARSVNPDITFDVVWLNTWFSPSEEESISNLLIDRGADVLMAHTNTTKPTEVAEARGALAFGQASDMSAYGPTATMTATINNWGPYYVRRIAALLDGSWSNTDTWGGFADEMIALGPLSERIDPRTRERVMQTAAAMADGSGQAFVGPLKRQDGSVWLAAGERAGDPDLNRMMFYLEGMNAELPQLG